MHEASLAANVLRIVSAAAAGREARVVRVTVSVGELAGVMPDALLFAFDALKKDTPLAHAALVLEKEPVRARCEACGTEYLPAAFPYRCPACADSAFQIIGGEDVSVRKMELKQDERAGDR